METKTDINNVEPGTLNKPKHQDSNKKLDFIKVQSGYIRHARIINKIKELSPNEKQYFKSLGIREELRTGGQFYT